MRMVLSPLGLTSLDFKKDGRGNPLPATDFELRAREVGAARRIGAWPWQLIRGSKLFPQLARPGIRRIRREPLLCLPSG